MHNEATIVAAIKSVIGDPKHKCYIASEAAYHLLGGKEAGYTPVCGSIPDPVIRNSFGDAKFTTHWWLRRKDGSILDITADQFNYIFPYEAGRGRGFMTKQPSVRAQEIIDNARDILCQ